MKENLMSTINKQKIDEFLTHIKTLHPKTQIFITSKADNIIVDALIVNRTQKNKGVGTDIMNRLINFADENNWEIALTPDGCFGGNEQRLEIFYRRFGFTTNNQPNAQETMIRHKKL